MRINDIKIGEADILITRSATPSIDPGPQREPVNVQVIKSMVEDHINALRTINKQLLASAEIVSALGQLEDQYGQLFGRKLNELLSSPSKQVNAAALELRKRLRALAVGSNPDLSYSKIDGIMHDICGEYKCEPKSLHDLFIERFNKTPDQWAKDYHVTSRQ